MSALIISPEQVAQISKLVESKSKNITYEINTPSREVENILNTGALLFWKEVVKEGYESIDSIQDNEETDDFFTRLGLDMKPFLVANVEYEIPEEAITALLASRDNRVASHSAEIVNSFSVADINVLLAREILWDIASGWMDCIREAIEEVTGTDPLNGWGIEFSKK